MHSEMAGPLPWAEVDRQLRESRNYWLSTTRADGRPHAMPIWGVWLQDALWFGTGLESVKGHNLAREPRCTVHLESGDDVVIAEGRAERAEDDAAYAAYSEKYDMPADAASFEALPQVGALFRFTPEIVHAWSERAFVESRATFRF